MTGTFIVLDGPDGSGTTYHSATLAKNLQREKKDVLLTAEPTDGTIGRCIRDALCHGHLPADALQLLFTADRADHLACTVMPALAQGMTIVSDRYVSSTVAYGAALGLDVPWLQNMNKNFIRPDVQIFLLPPIEVALQRLEGRPSREVLEKRELQIHVHAAYRKLAEEDPSIIVIDSSGEKNDVADMIWQRMRT